MSSSHTVLGHLCELWIMKLREYLFPYRNGAQLQVAVGTVFNYLSKQ